MKGQIPLYLNTLSMDHYPHFLKKKNLFRTFALQSKLQSTGCRITTLAEVINVDCCNHIVKTLTEDNGTEVSPHQNSNCISAKTRLRFHARCAVSEGLQHQEMSVSMLLSEQE